MKARNAAHYDANRDSHAERNKRWKRDNAARNVANVSRRRAAEKRAVPSWLTPFEKESINLMYKIAGALSTVHCEPFHVDHIVPLLGKTVSGLHVLSNLQVMPATVNHRKYNKFAG